MEELTKNSELRTELKKTVAVERSLNNSFTSVKTPDELTNNIFASLGFSSPLGSNKKRFAGGVIFLFWSKYRNPFLVSLASSIATLLIALLLLKDDVILNENAQTFSSPISYVLPNMNESIAVIPEDKCENCSTNNDGRVAAEVNNTTGDMVRHAETLGSSNKENSSVRHMNIDYANLDLSLTPDLEKVELEESYSLEEQQIELPSISRNEIQNQRKTFWSNWEFSIRQTESMHLPKQTISPESFSYFYKSGLGIKYKIDNRFSLGLDVRQETFYLEYYNVENNGIKYKYFIQPNFTSFSIAGKAKLFDIYSSGLSAEFSSGINSVGFVNRIGLELEYPIYKRVSVFFGFEYSSMLYEQMNDLYNSNKVSLNYGIRF
jgi:hypothetical protein